MPHRGRFLLLSVLFLLARPGWSDDRLVVADFSGGTLPAAWQVKERSGKADLAIVRDDGVAAVRLRSSRTSFSVQRDVQVDLKQYPILSWKWKVTRLPQGGDYRAGSRDDQAAQLFLAFSRTRAIVYIWDTSAPEGTSGEAAAPPFMTIKAVVVRSGPARLGAWITETRNVAEDYQNLFHEEPGPVQGMRLQINSQHTGTSAESYFADVAFGRTRH